MFDRKNPYDWQRHRPEVEVARSEVSSVVDKLRRGKSGVLLAGRGMGKSVFLRQLHGELSGVDGVHVLLFSEPPAELTVKAFLETLARRLGVEVEAPLGTRELIESYFEKEGSRPLLVLLYDELDRYAPVSHLAIETPPGRQFFNNLESVRRDLPVGVLAAGSIGVFGFRDAFGSSFMARADAVRLKPFAADEVETLAEPFAERGRALNAETLEALHLMSGGNPALVSYGLESLWSLPEPTERDVARTFARFQQENRDFIRDFQLAFSAPGLSEAPARVWELIQRGSETISHRELADACKTSNGSLDLDFADVLDVLESAGLIRLINPPQIDPVRVRPVTGVLSLPRASPPESRFVERFRGDLERLLSRIHAGAADFFRPGTGGRPKQLVPEAVFSAFLALGFELLGWRSERESQRGAGRTDVRLRLRDAPDIALIEVKIWGRHGYREAHRQLEGYWTDDVTAGAVVMLTDAEIADWTDVYRRECLVPLGLEAELSVPEASQIQARFECRTQTTDGLRPHVDHLLLRVPRSPVR